MLAGAPWLIGCCKIRISRANGRTIKARPLASAISTLFTLTYATPSLATYYPVTTRSGASPAPVRTPYPYPYPYP